MTFCYGIMNFLIFLISTESNGSTSDLVVRPMTHCPDRVDLWVESDNTWYNVWCDKKRKEKYEKKIVEISWLHIIIEFPNLLSFSSCFSFNERV